jgi:2'-5' RNA ligase
MDAFETSVMIALLPTTSEWCQIDLPHMTLVYAGEIPDLKPTVHNDLAKATIALAMACHPVTVDVLGRDVFGDNDQDQVEVLLLNPSPELVAMRSMVQLWDVSEHPFNPHVTIGPVGIIVKNIPSTITFDRIMVGWGNDQLIYTIF